MAKVQLWNLVEHGQQQHHSNQSSDQVNSRAYLVHLSVLLLGIISRDEVAQSDCRQGDKAVIERIQQSPLPLRISKYEAGNQQKCYAQNQNCKDRSKIRIPVQETKPNQSTNRESANATIEC